MNNLEEMPFVRHGVLLADPVSFVGITKDIADKLAVQVKESYLRKLH